MTLDGKSISSDKSEKPVSGVRRMTLLRQTSAPRKSTLTSLKGTPSSLTKGDSILDSTTWERDKEKEEGEGGGGGGGREKDGIGMGTNKGFLSYLERERDSQSPAAVARKEKKSRHMDRAGSPTNLTRSQKTSRNSRRAGYPNQENVPVCVTPSHLMTELIPDLDGKKTDAQIMEGLFGVADDSSHSNSSNPQYENPFSSNPSPPAGAIAYVSPFRSVAPSSPLSYNVNASLSSSPLSPTLSPLASRSCETGGRSPRKAVTTVRATEDFSFSSNSSSSSHLMQFEIEETSHSLQDPREDSIASPSIPSVRSISSGKRRNVSSSKGSISRNSAKTKRSKVPAYNVVTPSSPSPSSLSPSMSFAEKMLPSLEDCHLEEQIFGVGSQSFSPLVTPGPTEYFSPFKAANAMVGDANLLKSPRQTSFTEEFTIYGSSDVTYLNSFDLNSYADSSTKSQISTESKYHNPFDVTAPSSTSSQIPSDVTYSNPFDVTSSSSSASPHDPSDAKYHNPFDSKSSAVSPQISVKASHHTSFDIAHSSSISQQNSAKVSCHNSFDVAPSSTTSSQIEIESNVTYHNPFDVTPSSPASEENVTNAAYHNPFGVTPATSVSPQIAREKVLSNDYVSPFACPPPAPPVVADAVPPKMKESSKSRVRLGSFLKKKGAD